MLRLDFSADDLKLPELRTRVRRSSISGVQDKVQLRRVRGGFEIVESGGDHILKPVPRNTSAELAADIPANEAVTMDIAGRIFGINVAKHELVMLSDGEYAYLTKRFGVNAQEVREMLSGFPQKRDSVCRMIEASMLSDAAKGQYLMRFLDRLNAIAQ